MGPIRYRIQLPPKPSFKSGRRYRRTGPPREPIRGAPLGRRLLQRERDLREILSERERPARELFGSAWRWMVVAGAWVHLAVAPFLGGTGDPAYVAAAGILLGVVSFHACFSATPGLRVTFAVLTLIGVACYAFGVGCPALAGTWIVFCLVLAFLRLRALDREEEREEEIDAGPESSVAGILRRRMEGETGTGAAVPPPEEESGATEPGSRAPDSRESGATEPGS